MGRRRERSRETDKQPARTRTLRYHHQRGGEGGPGPTSWRGARVIQVWGLSGVGDHSTPRQTAGLRAGTRPLRRRHFPSSADGIGGERGNGGSAWDVGLPLTPRRRGGGGVVVGRGDAISGRVSRKQHRGPGLRYGILLEMKLDAFVAQYVGSLARG